MRVARLERCQDESGLDAFLDAFTTRGLTASSSRLSRWEYGRSKGTRRLLRAYEDGTGLPPYVLFALNDRQRRADEDTFAAVPSIDVSEGVTAEGIDEILDRAVSSAEVTGSDWYLLAGFTSVNGYFYLSPRNTRILARRLIEELARSVGPAYILRFEALHLLASMNRVHDALVEELAEMIEDGSAGAIGDAVSLILRAAPAVRTRMVDHLRTSESPMVRQGSSWIRDILKDRQPAGEPLLARSAVSAQTDAVCRALPEWAMAHVEADMTRPLIESAIGGRSRLDRHEASLLLMLAGIQTHTEQVLLDLFEEASDPIMRRRLANLQEYLLPATKPQRLEGLALDETDPEARRALWGSRGHVFEPVEVTAPIREALADPDAQYGVSYALGISGSIDEALLADSRSDEALHEVLEWWHSRGPGLLV